MNDDHIQEGNYALEEYMDSSCPRQISPFLGGMEFT